MGEGTGVTGTIQAELVGAGVETVEAGPATALGQVAIIGMWNFIPRGSCCQEGQRQQIPILQWEIQNDLLLDHRSHLGGVGVDDRGVARNRDHEVGDVSRLKGEVEPGHLGHLQTNIPQYLGLKTWVLSPDLVAARYKLVDEVVSPVIAVGRPGYIGG